MADQAGTRHPRGDSVSAAYQVRAGHGQGDRRAADGSGDGLGGAAGEAEESASVEDSAGK